MEGQNYKNPFLCLHCLLQYKSPKRDRIVELPYTYSGSCPECGWRYDFEEDLPFGGSFIFIRVLIDEDGNSQQSYPPLTQKTIKALPPLTQDALIRFLKRGLHLRIPYLAYQKYLNGELNAKELISHIEPDPHREKPHISQERKSRDADLRYTLKRNLDEYRGRLKEYKTLIRQVEAQMEVGKFLKKYS